MDGTSMKAGQPEMEVVMRFEIPIGLFFAGLLPHRLDDPVLRIAVCAYVTKEIDHMMCNKPA